ncbi:nucleotidyltransferase domain-containing protein [Gottfriedia acidiceleris]|uniref:nucleotidyltransferase domain-containing protein n=1 Tax=Gottfriedia acidiceleris TaxID=371036 RepID=UPI001F438CEC|nr:hypothetical protein [Gottfriedia acidiceleris]
MDNNNLVEKQLKILNEINTICLNLKFHLWLRGGWAIDFLLGKVTREHSDIDLVTLIQYREELERAMVNAGFKKIPISMLQTDFIKDEIDVSFVFVRISEEGKIIANGFPDWEWRNDALPIRKYNLKGISINVLNPYQLLEEKMVYEKGTGRKLRSKDIESMKVIQGIINSIS